MTDDEKDFAVTIESVSLMTPSARKPCVAEMVSEGLLTPEQGELILRLAGQADCPKN